MLDSRRHRSRQRHRVVVLYFDFCLFFCLHVDLGLLRLDWLDQSNHMFLGYKLPEVELPIFRFSLEFWIEFSHLVNCNSTSHVQIDVVLINIVVVVYM